MTDILVVFVSERVAERFYSDPHFILEATCPHCKVETEIEHDDISAFDLPEEVMNNVVYPSVGICQRCGRTVIVGYKPIRARIKQIKKVEDKL